MRRGEVLNFLVGGSEEREAMKQQVPAHDVRCHCLRTIVRSRMPQDRLCAHLRQKRNSWNYKRRLAVERGSEAGVCLPGAQGHWVRAAAPRRLGRKDIFLWSCAESNLQDESWHA